MSEACTVASEACLCLFPWLLLVVEAGCINLWGPCLVLGVLRCVAVEGCATVHDDEDFF